jgi:hypothetical protein
MDRGLPVLLPLGPIAPIQEAPSLYKYLETDANARGLMRRHCTCSTLGEEDDSKVFAGRSCNHTTACIILPYLHYLALRSTAYIILPCLWSLRSKVVGLNTGAFHKHVSLREAKHFSS